MTRKISPNMYEPDQLQTLFNALNTAPGWLSRRFILTNLCGWSEEMVTENLRLRGQEEQAKKSGDRLGGYQ